MQLFKMGDKKLIVQYFFKSHNLSEVSQKSIFLFLNATMFCRISGQTHGVNIKSLNKYRYIALS